MSYIIYSGSKIFKEICLTTILCTSQGCTQESHGMNDGYYISLKAGSQKSALHRQAQKQNYHRYA
jgi:hypothetical protein